ncbi:MAG: serine/threonine-protein kinase [Longimicrobiales bacterium]|nr:serine/threonine-protein kinase [Longimicrobiales bacterium]
MSPSPSPERRREIEELFDGALDRAPAERDPWLERVCADDPELLAEVRALLRAHELADEIFPDRRHPDSIGPYRVIRELGRGGMGVVYLAERADGQYQRRVAIKVLSSSADAGPLHQRFLAERQILAGLRHPNIAQMLDGGLTRDRRPYFVLEYVDGIPITEYCRRHELGVEERLRLFLDVCSAVQHAHRSLIIHRDLKPGNILVTDEGQVRLLDFGIAKLLEPGSHPARAPVTRMDMRVMTPEYASPEQVRGDPLTTASDVYALGVLLYELLTGSLPYDIEKGSLVDVVCDTRPLRPSAKVREMATRAAEAATDVEGPEARAEAPSPSPERLSRRLRGDLDSIVLMALRKEPDARYRSADLLREDIERHLASLPVLAHRGGRRYRLGRFLRRYRVESAAAALVALSLIGGTAVASWQATIASREQARAEAERATAEGVSRFLEGLFASVDPYAPTPERVDTLSVREILDRGVARVRTDLAAQPRVRAQMLDVVGRVYSNLGLYEDARQLLEESVALRRGRAGTGPDGGSIRGADPPQDPASRRALATSLADLGVLLMETGDYERARSLLEEALEIRRSLPPDDDHPEGSDPAIATTLNQLGRVHRLLGHYGEAEALHFEAMAMLQSASGDSAPELATFMTDLVRTLEWAGDREREERWARESVALHRRLFGDSHPALAVALRDLGLVLQRNADFAPAEERFRESYEIAVDALGRDHPQVADLLNRIASIRWWRGDLATADSIHVESIALKRRIYGDLHLEVAYGLNNLASVRRDSGLLESADSLHAEAVEITRSLVGEDHAAYWILLGNHASTWTAGGDCERSIPVHRAIIDGLRRTIPADRDRYPIQMRWLGECLIEVGRYEEADSVLRESMELLRPRGEGDRFYRDASATLERLRRVQVQVREKPSAG